jgi:hypothetical protein
MGELAEEWLAIASARPGRLPPFPIPASLGGTLLGLLGSCRAPTKIDVARLRAATSRSPSQPARRFVSGVFVSVSPGGAIPRRRSRPNRAPTAMTRLSA